MDKKNLVHVVAWEYDTGGGFDWYFTPEAAAEAFEKEKANCDDPGLKEENWEAVRFDFPTDLDPQTQREEVTDEIDMALDEMFQAATVRYKAA